jgi:hypothetical protein
MKNILNEEVQDLRFEDINASPKTVNNKRIFIKSIKISKFRNEVRESFLEAVKDEATRIMQAKETVKKEGENKPQVKKEEIKNIKEESSKTEGNKPENKEFVARKIKCGSCSVKFILIAENMMCPSCKKNPIVPKKNVQVNLAEEIIIVDLL